MNKPISPKSCAVTLAAATAALSLSTHAGTSPIVGLYKVAIPGNNATLASAPLHARPALIGTVASVSGNIVTLTGSPGLASGTLGPVSFDALTFSQYALFLKKDASATPGNQGDWFPITANTAGTVTVNPGSQTLTAVLAAGDTVEIRRLTSLRDIYGTGASCILNKDDDLDQTIGNDLVRFALGTSFGFEVFYHDGSVDAEGYYVEGTFAGDGSQVTVGPDEPVWTFRDGVAPATAVIKGNVHEYALTHYLEAGPNPVATGYPVGSPIGASKLLESGWVQDDDLDQTLGNDLARGVVGTGFSTEIFYHDGTLDLAGWYVDGGLDNLFPIPPVEATMYFVTSSLIWRQPSPTP